MRKIVLLAIVLLSGCVWGQPYEHGSDYWHGYYSPGFEHHSHDGYERHDR